MDRRAGSTAAGICAAALLLALPAAAHADVTLKRCGRGGKVRCAQVVVPLDRSGALPGTVSLNVHVLPARVSRPTGTILLLAGGPGQAAAGFAGVVPEALGAVADANQIVAFDQRGTGKSGFLRCRALQPFDLDATAAARCAAQIGPRRTAYTTAASVEDIDAVRAALGVDKLTILGVSYGTKVALDYASAHPDHVSRLILDSTLDPANPDPFSLSTFAAMPRVLRTLCADDCSFTDDVAADLDTVAARLRRGPLYGPWIDPHGRARRSRVTGSQLLALIGATDLNPLVAAMLPGALHSAARGDLTPLIGLPKGASTEQLTGGDSNAVLLATNCEDMAPVWPIGTPVDQRAPLIAGALAALPDTAFGAFGARIGTRESVPEVCRTWPESPIAQPPVTTTDAPTLILSGDLDLRTPREVADGLAARLPNAQVVHVSGIGHSVLTTDLKGCVAANTAAFLAGQPVSDCTASKPFVPVLAPAPIRLADVPPAGGPHGTVGRVANGSDDDRRPDRPLARRDRVTRRRRVRRPAWWLRDDVAARP